MRFFRQSKPAPKKRPKAKKKQPKAVFSFRRHILPPLLGLLVMIFIFLLLNAPIIEAQLKYHFAKPIPPAVVEADTKKAVANPPAVSAPPVISIPRIGLSAPIIFEPSIDETAVENALAKGVDHYGTTANPGQAGNTVIFGHSGGALWSNGQYKYAFTLLNRVQANDKIIIAYKGINYVYNVTSTEIILPTNLSILNQTQHTPNLTLVTCSPIGTNKYRLVVHAVQTSPVPTLSTPKAQTAVQANPILPGNSSVSFWHYITSWL